MSAITLSATSIQDFKACQRRFQLQHLINQPWPAVQAEPLYEHELHARRGTQFHLTLQRYFSDIHPDILSSMIDDVIVKQWWDTFQAEQPVPRKPSCRILPECSIVVEVQNYRLRAVIDLLVLDSADNSITIFDWKTTRRIPDAADYRSAIQTSIYQYIVAVSAPTFFPAFDALDRLKMVYWFPAYPDSTISLTYSEAAHQRNTTWLSDQIETIDLRIRTDTAGEWNKTSDLTHCRYCDYRSLCERDSFENVYGSPGQLDVDSISLRQGMDYGQL